MKVYMKNYNSLNELKNSITGQLNSEIALENINLSFLQANEVLIELKNNLIGDIENTSFLRIYNWMQKKNFFNYNIYILLPQDIERFSPVFISTLYLFNQGIKSQFVILGHKDNSRTYEFTFFAHSGLLSQNDLNFFIVASYNNENSPFFWFSLSNTKAVSKYVVSEKDLPLISIDNNNFDFYFRKAIQYFFNNPYDGNLFIIEKGLYNNLRNSFNSLSVDELKEAYIKLHFYKLLDNLNCLYRFYLLLHKHEKDDDMPPYEE